MANLSNINGKFVVDTAGNIGVGTLVPRSDANTTNISIQSSGTARLFVNNTGASGKEYAIYSSANGDFGIFDYNAVSARLLINSAGNATFAGNLNISSPGDLYINSGTSYNNKGSIFMSNQRTEIVSDIVNATANGDTSLNFKTRSAGATASAMFIDEFRRVGIGTTLPDNKLDVRNGELTVRPSSSGNGGLGKIGHSSSNAILQLYDSSGNEDVRISTSLSSYFNGGNVGIGTDSPNAKLEVVGEVRVYTGSNLGYWGVDSGNSYVYLGTNTSGYGLSFQTSGAEKMRIDSSGTVGINNSSLKTVNTFQSNLFVGETLYIANYNVSSNQQAVFGCNTYYNSGYKAVTGATSAAAINIGVGAINFNTAPTVAADNTQTFTTRMHIQNGGNVGIGTTSPTNLLTINDPNANGSITDTIPSWWGLIIDRAYTTSSSAAMGIIGGTVATGSSGRLYLGNSDDVDSIYIDGGANQMHFAVAGGERMRIDSSGNVGIGSTSPGANLEIKTLTGGAGVNTLRLNTNFANGNTVDINPFISGLNNGGMEIKLAGSQKLVMLPNGDVGIGTTSPGAKLEVNAQGGGVGGYTGIKMKYGTSSVQSLYMGQVTAGNGAFIGTAQYRNAGYWQSESTASSVINMDAGGNMAFYTNSGLTANTDFNISERFRITNVGRTYINSNAYSRDAFTMMQGDTSTYVLGLDAPAQYASLYRYQTFFSGSNIAGTITGSNQTSISYNTSSDYRMKKNIKPLENGLKRLCELKPVKFDWKENNSSSEGFIAHEVQEIFPDAISGEKDSELMQGMDYGRITPLLVKAIQELKADNDSLKARIETLENN